MNQCYVAGAYTANTATRIQQNISKALAAGCVLCAHGWRPIVPHASGSHRRDWEKAMTTCREIIAGLSPASDALVLMPGWEQSKGTCEERDLALAMGLRVLTLVEALERPVA
jgi:hypothetical protein